MQLEGSVAEDVLASLREHAVEDAQKRFGGAVAVSADGPNLFAYADSREAVHDAESIIGDLLREQGLQAEMTIHRWHDLEERWEDEDVPLPQTEAERQAEHERLEADEAAESQASGRAFWEVRVELPSLRSGSIGRSFSRESGVVHGVVPPRASAPQQCRRQGQAS